MRRPRLPTPVGPSDRPGAAGLSQTLVFNDIGPMTIDRCYCYDQTFAALKAMAEETGADSIEALQRHVTFGQNCQLCHPYVRRMLETGQTTFHEVIEADADDGTAGAGGSP